MTWVHLSRRLIQHRAAAPFRGHDRRAGDLGQRPPLPLRRRLVAVGRGDDASYQSPTRSALIVRLMLPQRLQSPSSSIR